MKTIKPQKLSVLFRVFEHQGRKCFVPTVMLAFPLEAPDVPLHEVVLWKAATAALGEGAVFDEMMFKPAAEVLLTGHAHAPGDEPVAELTVHLRLGSVDKSLLVTGDRHWEATGHSEPVPFERIPLDWSRGYGGEGFADNPVGLGAAEISVDGKMRTPLPNVEYADQRVSGRDDKPTPASFSGYPFQWPQRQRLAGTYDEAWRKKRYPGLADDIDLAMFNVAPDDQRLDGYLEGGEPFQLHNLSPSKATLTGALPTHRARCFIARHQADKSSDGVPELEEIALQRDTVHFFPDAGIGVLFFRGVATIDSDDASDVTHLVAAFEAKEQDKGLDHYQAAMARRLEGDNRALASLKDSELLPPPIESHAPLDVERFGDMDLLFTSDGLLDKHQRRAAELQLEKARQQLRDEGVDPDEHLPKELPPEPPAPTLDNLEETVAKLELQADEAFAEAEKKRTELEQKAKEAMAEAGVDPLAEPTRKPGPPAFSADEQLTMMRQQAQLLQIADKPDDALIQQLTDPAFEQRLREAEQTMRDNYRQLAHMFPEPVALEAERSAALRDEVERAARAGESLRDRDLSGANLSGLDLSALDLTGAMLEGADLTDAKLDAATLDGAVLARTVLTRTQLAGASLVGTNLGAAKLDGTVLDGANAKDAVFTATTLRNTTLSDVKLDGADFRDATFEDVQLVGIEARRLTLLHLDLRSVDLSRSKLSECLFFRCQLQGASFANATLGGSMFVDCDADKADFSGVDGGNLRIAKDSRFAGASFKGAQLDGCAFRGTDLSRADFREASLQASDLSACDLSGSNFGRANASGSLFLSANLSGAVLIYANLKDANLQKANIRGADFRESNLFRVDFARIDGDETTKLDGALKNHVRFVQKDGGMA